MAKPTELGEWATTPGQTLEPETDQKAAGFNEGAKPPARWINWLWNVAYQWHQYLGNLHNEVQFLNKAYAWLGEHSFAEPIQGDLKLTGEVLYDEAKPRKAILPLRKFQPAAIHESRLDGITSWLFGDTTDANITYWRTVDSDEVLVGHFRLPPGATVFYVGVRANIAAGASLTLSVSRLRFTTTPGSSAESASTQDLMTPTTTPGPWDADTGSLLDGAYSFDPETDLLRVRLKTGSTAGVCRVSWVELTYNEPGPHH